VGIPHNTAIYFKLYFDDDIVDLLVAETNRYAQQYISSNVIVPYSAVNEWHPTNHHEVLAFPQWNLLEHLQP